MTDPHDGPRPRRADVADSYDQGVDAYESLWSPLILPPAAGLIARLDLSSAGLVADIGAGTGALLPAIRAAAPSARVVALDASAGMLRVARAAREATAIQADALALPMAAQCADAVLLAYMLFHVADPVQALRETARVLRPAGRAATITWAFQQQPRASAIWEQILADAGVPPGPVRVADDGLDEPQAVESALNAAGLRPVRVWTERLSRQWDRESYLRLASERGASQVRLALVDSAVRAGALWRFRRAVGVLGPDDLRYEGEVICAIAELSG